jgi:osmotically-inducible protein OsmY
MRRMTIMTVAVLAAVTAAAPRAGAADDVRKREAGVGALLVEKLGKDAEAIRVTLTGDKVILTGEVENRSVQELAEEVALFFDGVASVDNQVTARHDPKLGKGLLTNEAGDSELETTVKMRLRGEIGTHAEKIEVEAVGGWVSLRGVAPEKARRDIALATAAGTKGVTKVIDLLRIAK